MAYDRVYSLDEVARILDASEHRPRPGVPDDSAWCCGRAPIKIPHSSEQAIHIQTAFPEDYARTVADDIVRPTRL